MREVRIQSMPRAICEISFHTVLMRLESARNATGVRLWLGRNPLAGRLRSPYRKPNQSSDGESRAVRDAFRREAGDDVFAGIVLVASKKLSGSGYPKGAWRKPPPLPTAGQSPVTPSFVHNAGCPASDWPTILSQSDRS